MYITGSFFSVAVRTTLVVLFSTLSLISAHAATFTVNTPQDTNNGCNSECSLREAIIAANAAAGDDVIEFSSSFNTAQTITMNDSEMVFENNGTLTINGRGANLLTISGFFSSRIFRNNGATVVLNGMTLYGGTGAGASSGLGGAILNLSGGNITFNNSEVRNSSANQGGGIYNAGTLTLNNTAVYINNSVNGGAGVYSNGALTLNNSTVRENSTTQEGAGIFNNGATVNINNSTINNNTASADGGGIYNAGTLNLTASTINSNTSENGGGVFNATGSTVVSVVNSTFSGNSAKGGGGGLYASNGSAIIISSSTFSVNISDADSNGSGSGGGINNTAGGTVNLLNSILGDNADRSGNAPDFSGTLTSQGYNLIENTLGTLVTGTITGNITGQSARLLPLGNYGGSTRTHALQSNSPAIDTANPVNFSSTDQRGVTRPQDGDLNTSALPDIGAFERQLTSLMVTKTADTNDGTCDADCSLREALNTTSGNSTRETIISFSPAVFNAAQTITLTAGELLITDGIFSINGTGANLLTLSGNNLNRVFQISSSGTAIIKNLTVTAGKAPSSPGVGGGIYNNGGTLSLNGVTVSNNTAGFGGGGISSFGGLLITNSSITGNISNFEGGGIANNGTMYITDSTISGNRGTNGAGIRTTFVADIKGSTINSNTGIGIYNDTGTLSISGSTINANTGGGIQNVFSGTTNITNSVISNNSSSTSTSGAGIFSGGTLSIANTTISGNSGGRGGGIYCGGTANLTNVAITGNSASNDLGGGMYINNGSVTINNSIIGSNSSGNGGGIASNIPNAVNITNTTINGNTASNSGGGIRAFGPYNLTNVTVSNNTANFGGGVSIIGSAAFTARNSIFGDNQGNSSAPDFSGTLTSQGYNLIENTSGTIITGTTTGNILGQDPQLTPLRNNGGTTQTVGLQPTSPAIDAADPNNFPATDQRGIARPQDGDLNGTALPDIGAYERNVSLFTVTKTIDTNDGACTADCSLREAVTAANFETNPDSGILFDSSFAAPQTILLDNGEIVTAFHKTLAIYGTGANLLTISGRNQSRIFYNGASLLLSGIRLTSGNGVGTNNTGFGGAINSSGGFLAVANSIVSGNSAQFSGGAIFGGQDNSGGVVRILNSIISNNTALNNGGGIKLSGISGSILNSVIAGNSASDDGGGIHANGTNYVLTVSNSKITNNSAITDNGGGIYVETFAASFINDSEITANAANGKGGGIFNFGNLTVLRSTIAANSAQTVGGGIMNDLDAAFNATNTTISGNFANNHGGGIYNILNSSVTLNNSTVAFNKTNGIGGGIFNTSAGTVNARNTIIARNEAVIQSPDVEKTLASQGYNLIGNTSGAAINGTTIGNLLNVDPRLDPILRNNGGTTQTHALRVGSPVLDKGSAIAGVSTDERGFIRPFDFPSVPNASGGNGSDIGAFEQNSNDIIRSFTPFDFDGDAKTDISIFRPNAGEWWINRSSSGQTVTAQFGASTDKPAPADFTGDGRTDVAFWRPSTGEWFILRSEDSSFLSFTFGASGDVPVVGDFDGDGKADPCVYRPSTNEWFVLKSSGGVIITTFGTAGDLPVTADYDGDGKTDIAIFRPSNGSWWYVRSMDNEFRVFTFGVSTDKPVQGDYTGDGRADIAVWRPSTGEWFFQRSEDNSFYSVPFGASGDLPAPGDYDGDGKFDTAVFRPSDSTWYVQRSTAGTLIAGFGISGDRPLPNVFIP